MKRGIYAIRDNASNSIGHQYLYLFATLAVAMRFFDDSMRAPNSILAQHPADFDLIQIGDIDEDGTIHPIHRIEMQSGLDETDQPTVKPVLVTGVETVITGKAWLAAQEQKPKLEA